MRELKFRAWDIKNKRFVNIVRLILDQFGALDYAEVVYEGKMYKLYPSEIVLEQDTGLEDKNGKRICEGDIVRVARSYGYGFLPKGAKAKIEFDEKELCYKLRGQGEFRLTAKKELEVIGNTHENKELLGGKNE